MKLKDKLQLQDTALIVIDIQNDFCAPDGLMARLGKNMAAMDELVGRVQTLVDTCEKVGVPILYTQQVYDRTKLNTLQLEQYDLDGKMVTCDINTDGYQLYRLTPSDDQVFRKYTYNIFSNLNLVKALEDGGIKTLVIVGVSTQICVETAIRNGFDLGYKIVVPEDLVGTTSSDPATQERTLKLVRKTYGVVSSLEEVISLLRTR